MSTTPNTGAGWCIPCREYHDNLKPWCHSGYQYSGAREFDEALEVEALGKRLQAQFAAVAPTPATVSVPTPPCALCAALASSTTEDYHHVAARIEALNELYCQCGVHAVCHTSQHPHIFVYGHQRCAGFQAQKEMP